MPQFSKSYQPKPWRRRGGRPPSPATIAKRITEEEKKEKEWKEKHDKEWNRFLSGECGSFSGIDFYFSTEFHKMYNRSDAIERLKPDCVGNVTTSAGYRYMISQNFRIAYVMTKEALEGHATRFVWFYETVYIF